MNDQELQENIGGMLNVGRRRITSLVQSLPILFQQRFSYFYLGRRIYTILPHPLRISFWVLMFVSIVLAVAEAVTIFVIAMFARTMSSPQSVRHGSLYKALTVLLPDSIAVHLQDDRMLIIAMCTLVVVFIIMKNIVSCVTTLRSTVFTEQVRLFLSQEAYGRFLAKEYVWHISSASKSMIDRLERRGSLLSLISSLIRITSNIISSLVMFAVLFRMNPKLTSAVVVAFSIACAVMYILLRRGLESNGAALRDIETKQNWSLRMVTNGIREIIIYRKQQVCLDTILNTIHEAIPHRKFLSASGSIPAWLLEVSGFAIIFAAMVYMIAIDRSMPLIVSSMSMLLLTAWRVLPRVSSTMRTAVHIRGIKAKAVSCLELFESFDDALPAEAAASAEMVHCTRDVELRNVCFRYPGAMTDTLNDVTVTIAKGEQLGLVGKSGGGKSTLAMIFAGLFRPSSGQVLVDGREITEDILQAYRKHIGYVPQSPLILPGTIADNVALGDWGKAYDNEKLNRVCDMAAMDFLGPGKKSLQTVIGEGGGGLSGGEAQRLSIARALYTDPDFVVLDEATSSLDQASENKIIESVNSLRGKITSLLIAHRLTSLEHCDRILWLENGTVKKQGPAAEILKEYSQSVGKK